MEQLKVLDFSDTFVASYFTDDCQCSHPNREHTLIYILSGTLEIDERGRKTLLHEGQCAFMRRDNRPDIVSLFQSIRPYFDSDIKPREEWLKMKMIEGAYILLDTDKSLYASLFDFTEEW